MRFATAAALAVLTAASAHAQSGGAALDFAHGMGALQRGEHELAREGCARAARALEQDPAARQQLGRAQLCVVDALVGLGQVSRAFDVLSYAVRNLEDGGRTQPRYAEDLRRAMGMVGPLSRQIARLSLSITPPELCTPGSTAQLAINGQPMDLSSACSGELLDVDAGRFVIQLSAPGYRTAERTVEAAPGRTTEAHLALTPDPGGDRWVQLRLSEPGTMLNGRGGQSCGAPCTLVVDAYELRQGFYFVAEAGVMRRIQANDLAVAPNPTRVQVPVRDVVRRSPSNAADWIVFGSGIAGMVIGGALLGSASLDDTGQSSFGAVLATGGLVALIVGIIMLAVPNGPPHYALVDPVP